MRFALIIFFTFFAVVAQSAVYKWTDENGKVHYSDKPIENSETVEFKSNTQNQIKLQIPSPIVSDVETEDSVPQYRINITSPSEEETIRDNEGNITIMATISPDLSTSHVLVLLMDGKVMGPPQNSPIFSLKDIDRGEHEFEIKVVAQNGKQLASTSPRKVFLHRAIVNRQSTPTPFNSNE